MISPRLVLFVACFLFDRVEGLPRRRPAQDSEPYSDERTIPYIPVRGEEEEEKWWAGRIDGKTLISWDQKVPNAVMCKEKCSLKQGCDSWTFLFDQRLCAMFSRRDAAGFGILAGRDIANLHEPQTGGFATTKNIKEKDIGYEANVMNWKDCSSKCIDSCKAWTFVSRENNAAFLSRENNGECRTFFTIEILFDGTRTNSMSGLSSNIINGNADSTTTTNHGGFFPQLGSVLDFAPHEEDSKWWWVGEMDDEMLIRRHPHVPNAQACKSECESLKKLKNNECNAWTFLAPQECATHMRVPLGYGISGSVDTDFRLVREGQITSFDRRREHYPEMNNVDECKQKCHDECTAWSFVQEGGDSGCHIFNTIRIIFKKRSGALSGLAASS